MTIAEPHLLSRSARRLHSPVQQSLRCFIPWIVAFAGCWLGVFGLGASAQEVLKLPLPTDGSAEMEFCAVPTGVGEQGGVRVFHSGDQASDLSWDLEAGGAFAREGKEGREWFYYLGKYEVTRGQWAVVMGGPRPEGESARLPQTGVSWYEVQEFLARCNEWLLKRTKMPRGVDGTPGVMRLPTEGEWEFAAGDAGTNLDEDEWHRGNAGGRLRPVGQKRANRYGLHDLLGNAREMTGDAYRLVPGWGPVGGPAVRGGDAWSEPGELRATRRSELSWTMKSAEAGAVGFRVMIGLAEAGGLPPPPGAGREHAGLEALDLDQLLAGARPALAKALADRVELPTPGGAGVMGFRAVRIGSAGEGATGFAGRDPAEAGGLPTEGARKNWVSGSCRDSQGWLYYLGEKEVSRQQWREVMGNQAGLGSAGPPADGALPVAEVSWPELQIFLQRYNEWLRQNSRALAQLPQSLCGEAVVVRLPTEVEWEYAARGGAKVAAGEFNAPRWYPLRDSDLYESAFHGGDRVVYATGSRKPNPLGLYDLLGNVSEMTLGPFQLGPGTGPVGGVCVRGGSARSETPEELRASVRYERRLYDRESGAPARSAGVGFRLALGAPWIVSPGPAPAEIAPPASSAGWGLSSLLAALLGLALGGQFASGDGWRFWEQPLRTQLKRAGLASLFGLLLCGVLVLVRQAQPVSHRVLIWSAGLGVSPWPAALALGALAGLVSAWPLRGAESVAVIVLKPLLGGTARGQVLLGRHCQARHRESEAAEWFLKAANAGNAEAQTRLGMMYETGNGVEQSSRLAVMWYRKAALESYALAQMRLAQMYEHGHGVSKSREEAVKWYEKAAAQGNPGALAFMALAEPRRSTRLRRAAALPAGRPRRPVGWWALGVAAILLLFFLITLISLPFSEFREAGPATDPAERAATLLDATPAPAPAPAPVASLVNSLGMKFLLVPTAGEARVLFSAWETRVQDYEAFATETQRPWLKPSFPQGPTHPAVNVTWYDAVAFCAWLSKKEGRTYRLPTDAEWSVAVGLGLESGRTPAEKDGKAPGYPWGTAFPPSKGTGNFDAEMQVDSFQFTAPVGSFPPNALGLYDLAGNALEWCEDWYGSSYEAHVLRGGSWSNPYELAKFHLRSSCRLNDFPTNRRSTVGFRCVLVAPAPGPATPNPTAPPPGIPSVIVLTTPKPSPAPKAAQAASPIPSPAGRPPPTFTNSLGLKFVPVPNTTVWFSIWDTRVQDFEVFAQERDLQRLEWKSPGFSQSPAHPVVNVSWNDAIAFCEWLTQRDRNRGLLTNEQMYRLPTDREWSRAVGLADEKGDSPEARAHDVSAGVGPVYPWGSQWPPPPDAGNYTGLETGAAGAIRGYSDDFRWTSPVGSFPPNKYGLYDLGGNVWQWCMDNWNPVSKRKVLRGGSWGSALQFYLLSNGRVSASPDSGTDTYGFRVVRAPVDSRPPGTMLPPEAAAAQLAAGKSVYMTICFTCHQPTGLGLPMIFPPLTKSPYVGGSAERLVAIILKGSNPPFTMEGKVYAAVPMPGQEAMLSDDKVANVATYVRANFGNTAGVVTKEQVAAVRAIFADRKTPWLQPELDAWTD